jgi:hypothetical protein
LEATKGVAVRYLGGKRRWSAAERDPEDFDQPTTVDSGSLETYGLMQ